MKLLNMNQMRALFGVSRVTIYEWEKVGRIPKRINLYGSPRWNHEETVKTFCDYIPKHSRVKSCKVA